MEELRTYWEVPAVAHFCSLFRAVFKLIDFDIEDFEEALIVDTESAAEGGRSSLIVDVLTALLRGCLGRRDVTLLNYNGFLHDLLTIRWVRAGYGQNPLGVDRERACFHILPLYAKVKILHCLCEWRLERPDVETLTKDLNGDSLRVVPLGHDQKGATYWYFYGTRLYREEVVQQKSPKKSGANHVSLKNSTTPSSSRGRKKRRRRNYDFGAKKQKSSPKKRRHDSESSVDSVPASKRSKADPLDESMEDAGPSNVLQQVKQEEQDDENEEQDEDAMLQQRHWRPKLEPDLPVENASASPSFPATPASVNSTTTALVGVPNSVQEEDSAGFTDIIERLYSREDDEDDKSEQSEKRSGSNLPATDKDLAVVKVESAPEETNIVLCGNVDVKPRKPYIPEGPPPWDQPDLRPVDAVTQCWSLACFTLEDWRNLADSFAKPKGKNEAELAQILSRDFLPAMQDLFDQKEKDRLNKLAELMPRRQSDRLEVKRLQKEREEKILAQREQVERDRLVKVDEERSRRVEQEKREQRVRLRELEKEKKNLIKERAREERGRRLELRQRRQQLIAEGKDVPEDLLNATSGGSYMNDQELNELDIEIELEHMYGQLEKLLDQLKESEEAEPFLEPVKEEIAPDYYKVIEKPMDFTKIEDKLLYREYKNKGEFVEDINLMLLNCLQYNGLQSEYTKIAQRLERVFIKAWKRLFPPVDFEDSCEDARQEELHCISLLGILDKQIKDEFERVDAEEKLKIIDRKELARERKREADRRRRRLKAEARRAEQGSDKERLASQSLSSLSSPSSSSSTPRRQLAAPFLVGRSSLQGPLRPPLTLPARPVGSRFLPATTTPLRQQQKFGSGSILPSQPHSSSGLRTYIPGGSSGTPLTPNVFRGHLQRSRLVTSRTLPHLLASPQSSSNHQLAPITVQSSAASTRIIRVHDSGVLKVPSNNVLLPIKTQVSGQGPQGIAASSYKVTLPAKTQVGTLDSTTMAPNCNVIQVGVQEPTTAAAPNCNFILPVRTQIGVQQQPTTMAATSNGVSAVGETSEDVNKAAAIAPKRESATLRIPGAFLVNAGASLVILMPRSGN